MQLLTSTTALALLVTKLVDLVRNVVDPGGTKKQLKWLWVLLALVLGMAIALLFGLDVFQMFEHNKTATVAGQVLTGLGIGATGSGWHEVLDALSGTAKVTHAAAQQQAPTGPPAQ